jgi:hypothetical protein
LIYLRYHLSSNFTTEVYCHRRQDASTLENAHLTLESFLNRASQPVPSSSRPYYLSTDQNNNAATALLNTLSPTDVLHLRLVSTGPRLDQRAPRRVVQHSLLHSHHHQARTGTIVRTPTAGATADNRAIMHAFHYHYLIPTPPSIRTSTLTPQSYSASTSNANFQNQLPYPNF